MRLTEILNTIRNTFIRKKDKTEPDGNMEATEEQEAPEVVQVPEKNEELDSLEKQIRRYRAFAYHYRKKRIRKKYLKRLLDISPIDRFVYKVNQGKITLHSTWRNGNLIGVDYSSQKDFSPGHIGSRKMDHIDSRLIGGRWTNGAMAGYFQTSIEKQDVHNMSYSGIPPYVALNYEEELDEKQDAEFR